MSGRSMSGTFFGTKNTTGVNHYRDYYHSILLPAMAIHYHDRSLDAVSPEKKESESVLAKYDHCSK